jgi:Uma2 family endonuclease
MGTFVHDPMVLYNRTKFTEEEYLVYEKKSQEKHEFFQGEIFAMAGGSNRHAVIFSNLFGEIAIQLKGISPLNVVASAHQIKTKTCSLILK